MLELIKNADEKRMNGKNGRFVDSRWTGAFPHIFSHHFGRFSNSVLMFTLTNNWPTYFWPFHQLVTIKWQFYLKTYTLIHRIPNSVRQFFQLFNCLRCLKLWRIPGHPPRASPPPSILHFNSIFDCNTGFSVVLREIWSIDNLCKM